MNIGRDQTIVNFFTDNIREISEKTQRLIKKSIGLFAEGNFEGVKDLLEASKVMRYSIQAYIESLSIEGDEKDMLVQAGYTSAIIDSMQLYIDELKVQKEIQSISTRYKEDLLCILKRRGTLLHKDLAVELGLSDSGLTPVIKKMNSTSVKLVNVEEISKYKLYSLTPIANQYVVKKLLDKPRHDKTTDFKEIVSEKDGKDKETILEYFTNFAYYTYQPFAPMSNRKGNSVRYTYYPPEWGQGHRKFGTVMTLHEKQQA